MKALLEHFHEAVTTPEDVEMVKKYILRLAMQGKLVEQDPNDEPASVLLKRIEEEKKQLIKEKKIKKSKQLPPISQEEYLYKIPENWEWVRLGTIGDWGAGATPSRSNPEFYNGSIPWLKTGELNDNFIDTASEYITEFALERTSLRLNKPGDVLIAMYGATIGKLGILNIEATTNQACCACTPFNGIYNKFLFFFLLSQRDYFISQGAGGAQPNISKEKIVNSLFPLPPYSQQLLIVNKIEEMLKKCDELVSNLVKKQTISKKLNKSVFTRIQDYTNPEQMNDLHFVIRNMEHLCNDKESIDKLRNAVLSLAVQGKLVEQDANCEPATVLVETIKKVKDRLLTDNKIKKEKPLPPIKSGDIPFELPRGWAWVRLGEITTKLGAGKTPSGGQKSYVEQGVKFIRSQNVWNDGLLLEGIAHITQETHESMSGSAVQAKDILLNITGASIGRSSLVPDNFDTANVNQHVSIIRLVDENIRHYIHTCIISPYFQSEIMRVQVGASREGLSMAKLSKFIIPLPPLEEQKKIIEKVLSLISLIDTYENQIIKVENSTKSLFQSLTKTL